MNPERMTVRIETMTDADTDAVHAIESRSFPGDPWTRQLFGIAVTDDKTVCLCAKAEGAVAGYIVLRTVAGDGGIDNICVDDAYRRQGIARRMMEEAMEKAKTGHGAERFTLEVRVSNDAARALYESLGFACEGVRPAYYERPREDAAVYWKRNIS